MDKKKFNVAVAGATGAVGREMIKVLEERDFPVGKVRFLASDRSEGRYIRFRGVRERVSLLSDETFDGFDIALFSPGASVSKVYAPIAAGAGCIVIDNTSQFRLDKDIPLVVPEVNPGALKAFRNRNIIANPNCSTIQLVMALKPIHDRYRIRRVVVSTYQAVSGAGQKAVDELETEVLSVIDGEKTNPSIFPLQIAFNCLPHIDLFLDNGYTKEEMKMVKETEKIMGDDSIKVTATAVRVPVYVCHSESVNIETARVTSPEEIRDILSVSKGVTVLDDPKKTLYPTPVDCAGKDDVFVGRIRADESLDNGVNLWIVADNLRKGAALNAVQIAELLIRDYL